MAKATLEKRKLLRARSQQELSVVKNTTIAIVGAGHMGVSLARGFIHSGIKPKHIIVSGTKGGRLSKLENEHGIVTAVNNRFGASRADIIFIAVKPHVVKEVMTEIKPLARGKPLISVAAGLKVNTLLKWMGKDSHVARIMPNIPVATGDGVIGVYGGTLTRAQKDVLKVLLHGLGARIHVENENLLDAITVLSGSGPAVVSFLVGVFKNSATSLGISNKDAESIALHTFMGTLSNIWKESMSPDEMEHMVATRGGVTEAIISKLEAARVQKALLGALKEGLKRIKKISQ